MRAQEAEEIVADPAGVNGQRLNKANRKKTVARVVACTGWISAQEAHVSFLAEEIRFDLFTPP